MRKIADGVGTDGRKFALYLDDSQPSKPIPESPWIDVPEAEFWAFVRNYGKPLSEDLYMDWYSWNDFNRGNWPESQVARAYKGRDESDPDKFQLLKANVPPEKQAE